jgi:hypothetical protein
LQRTIFPIQALASIQSHFFDEAVQFLSLTHNPTWLDSLEVYGRLQAL